MIDDAQDFDAVERLWKKRKTAVATMRKTKRTLDKQLDETQQVLAKIQKLGREQLLLQERLHALRTFPSSVTSVLENHVLPALAQLCAAYVTCLGVCEVCNIPVPVFLACHRCNYNSEFIYITKGNAKWTFLTKNAVKNVYLHFVHEQDIMVVRHINLARNISLKSLFLGNEPYLRKLHPGTLPAVTAIRWRNGQVDVALQA